MMESDPRVTVLMAVYNGLPHVREAVDSILGQTFEGFEMLVLDDGSTDGSVEYLASIEDPRVRVKVGVEAADAPFIQAIDQGVERLVCFDVIPGMPEPYGRPRAHPKPRSSAWTKVSSFSAACSAQPIRLLIHPAPQIAIRLPFLYLNSISKNTPLRCN